LKRKWILVALVAVAVIAIAVIRSGHSRYVPDFNFAPIPKDAPTLNDADIEKILTMEQFRIFRRARQVPTAVRDSFTNFTNFPFDLADPGEEISSDLMIPGKSSRRLIFLGLSGDSAVLCFEQGGLVGSVQCVFFWFEEGGRDQRAYLDRGPIPSDIPSLRAAIRKRNFQMKNPQD
jgi:hypothetical protein